MGCAASSNADEYGGSAYCSVSEIRMVASHAKIDLREMMQRVVKFASCAKNTISGRVSKLEIDGVQIHHFDLAIRGCIIDSYVTDFACDIRNGFCAITDAQSSVIVTHRAHRYMLIQSVVHNIKARYRETLHCIRQHIGLPQESPIEI